jgi:uncharacterized membrane protein
MTRLHRFRLYLTIQAAVVVGVLLSFNLIPEKKIASVFAGSSFVIASIVIMLLERRHPQYKKHFTYWVTLGFFLTSALPIFLLRILNWNQSFSDLNLLGISAQSWHKYSNYAFMLMLMGYFVDSYLWNRRPENQPKK